MMEPGGKYSESGIQLGFEFTDLARENSPHGDVHLDQVPDPVRVGAEPAETARLEKPDSDPGQPRGSEGAQSYADGRQLSHLALLPRRGRCDPIHGAGRYCVSHPGGRPNARSPTIGGTGRPVNSCSAST